jgi:hypothetical protein
MLTADLLFLPIVVIFFALVIRSGLQPQGRQPATTLPAVTKR